MRYTHFFLKHVRLENTKLLFQHKDQVMRELELELRYLGNACLCRFPASLTHSDKIIFICETRYKFRRYGNWI